MHIQEKVKWNRLKTSLKFEELIGYLKSTPYTDQLGYGYSSLELRDDFLSTVYTEKLNRIETSVDPLGNEINQELVEYNSVNFSITKITQNLYLFSIINPPKSVKKFTDRFCRDLDYNVGFSAVNIDIFKYIDFMFTSSEVSLISIKKVKISNFKVNENAKATIEVTSKNNALDDLNILAKNTSYVIDKLKISCALNGERSDLEVSKNGTLLSLSHHLPFYTSVLMHQVSEI
ncbi:hypothetical protein ACP3TB_17160 [Rahnella variigena]|uniref:hypothetical protein n=1 Tax=Rahnella variigena TaxID=574964 RepID=UPI003CF1C64A